MCSNCGLVAADQTVSALSSASTTPACTWQICSPAKNIPPRTWTRAQMANVPKLVSSSKSQSSYTAPDKHGPQVWRSGSRPNLSDYCDRTWTRLACWTPAVVLLPSNEHLPHTFPGVLAWLLVSPSYCLYCNGRHSNPHGHYDELHYLVKAVERC